MDMSKIQNLGKNISSTFAPFAARSGQLLREQLGQAEDKTQLPADYLELEKRVDALKQVHSKMLAVTSQYSNEAYDYPPNLRESLLDLSHTISSKLQTLSTASTPADAAAALSKPGPKPAPKTFSHALGRAALSSSQLLDASDPLATALKEYALTSEKLGEARLAQDAQIVSRFNAAFSTTLNTNLQFAAKARKQVENARLSLDAAKARARNGGLGFNVGGKANAGELTEEQRLEIEAAEDEFVGATEEAVQVMKNVLDTPEPLRSLAEMVQAQLEYHRKCVEALGELGPLIESLQVEQEAKRSSEFAAEQHE